MTAPEKIWIDNQPYECHWCEGHITPDTAYFVGNYIRSDLYEAAQARIKKLEQLDSEAATHVESQIAMFKRFTGEPPYVGWRGLGLALKEELEAKDEHIKALESQLALAKIASEPLFSRRQLEDENAKLKTALNETADILNATGNPDLSNKLHAIAGGKDETK